jgi:hypothetical protein
MTFTVIGAIISVPIWLVAFICSAIACTATTSSSA